MLERALAKGEKVLGPDDPFTLELGRSLLQTKPRHFVQQIQNPPGSWLIAMAAPHAVA